MAIAAFFFVGSWAYLVRNRNMGLAKAWVVSFVIFLVVGGLLGALIP